MQPYKVFSFSRQYVFVTTVCPPTGGRYGTYYEAIFNTRALVYLVFACPIGVVFQYLPACISSDPQYTQQKRIGNAEQQSNTMGSLKTTSQPYTSRTTLSSNVLQRRNAGWPSSFSPLPLRSAIIPAHVGIPRGKMVGKKTVRHEE